MIDMSVKKLFFDRKAIIDACDKAARVVLSKFGAFVRTTARHSIRKRKAVSQPGQPPSSHVGLLRQHIYFGYDTTARSVVIGPAPLRSTVEAPPLLEYGGLARRRDRSGKAVIAVYRPRPYMGPAMEKELPKLPAMWRDSVR